MDTEDQDALTADEQAQMATMEAADQNLPADDKGGKKKPEAAVVTEGVKTEGEGADGKGGKDFVPLATYLEEKNERKALRDEIAQMQTAHQTQMTTAMDRFERALKAFAPKEPVVEAPKLPDFNEDPAGYIAARLEQGDKTLDQIRTELADLKKTNTVRSETETQQAAVRDIFAFAVGKENEFKAKTSDYDDASKFIIESRRGELEDMGYQPAQIKQMIDGERLTIALQSKQNGSNPAEVVYKLAKRRGYVTKASEGDKGKDGKELLDAARRGTEQAQSPNGARGNAPSPLTAARLLEMSEAEFARAIETPEGRALLGA